MMQKALAGPVAPLDRDVRALEREGHDRPRGDLSSVDSMLDWLEGEFGPIVRRVPKIERIVRDLIADLQARRRVRALVIGPRDSGMTLLAAAIQLLSVRLFGTTRTSIGGSLDIVVVSRTRRGLGSRFPCEECGEA